MGATATQNTEIVSRGYAAFNTADIATLTELFHEDASWHTPGRAIGGDYTGRDAAFGQFGRYGAETQGTFRAEVIDITESEDGHVVGIHRNTGERNGKQLDVLCCIVFELRDGQLVDGREHFFDLYAWDEFWS